jgi:hypothetical protein
MVISFAMICSCQKQDATAEQELAQRKTELDARENALDKKVKALFEKEQATLNAGTTASAVQGQTPDPAQVTAEKTGQFNSFAP